MHSPEELHADELRREPSLAQERDESRLRVIAPAHPEAIPNGRSHDMRNILPSDFGGRTTRIEVPDYGFIPDEWSAALLRGLQRVDFGGRTAIEPGVGTGNNAAYLASLPKDRRPKELWVGDYDERMAPVAARNADRMLEPDQRSVVRPCEGALSLIAWAERQKIRPDIVYGCLPQIPCDENTDLSKGDGYSHYYKVDRHEADIDDFGLGLQRALLLEARDMLPSHGKVVLNLGGRPGKDLLEQLFIRNGFQPEILHSEIIRQHAGTDLQPLAKREAVMKGITGHEFEFFGDPDGKEPINATEAFSRRMKGDHVYHNIYVVQGTLS